MGCAEYIGLLEHEEDYIEYDPAENESSEVRVLKLTVPQSEFLFLEARFPLFLAGYGAGKSTAMAASILRDLRFYHSSAIKIGCYCPTYDLLKLITIPYLCEFLEDSGIGYRLNKSDYIFTLDTGDQIIMRSLMNVERIVGYQTFRAHVDELDTLPIEKAEEAWNKIVARNRQRIFEYDEEGEVKEYYDEENGVTEKKTLSNRISAYTTPEGYNFCYKRWEKEKTNEHVTIKAPSYSNPNLDKDYIKNLIETYPPQLVDAYVEGKYVNLTSGSVYPDFCREENHTDEEIRQNEALEIGMDFNVHNMNATVGVVREGVPMVLDEITGARDTPAIIKIIQDTFPGHTISIFPDASGDNKKSSNASESDLSLIRAAGFKIRKDSKNPFVKDRVISVNSQILCGKGARKLKVNTHKCPDLTECLEQQVYDKAGDPDKKGGKDHKNECLGYWIFQKWPVKRRKGTLQKATMYAR